MAGGGVVSANTIEYPNLADGNYSIVVKDDNQCSFAKNVTVYAPYGMHLLFFFFCHPFSRNCNL